MTMLDLDVNSDIPARYHEKLGRGFKIVATNPFGHFVVLHAGNSTRVSHLPGTYTDINSAIKAIDRLTEEQLPAIRQYKTVLTPKVKASKEDDLE